MNMNHIEELRGLVAWVRDCTGKSANLDINFWAHKWENQERIEYKLWIHELFSHSSEDLGVLMALIPYIKELCLNNAVQKELAA